jgi:hypothetical protein
LSGAKKLRVLVACEFSGTVREAFRRLGHDAWSCDIEPTADGSPYHIQGCALTQLDGGWDLMIAHPPCTYLSYVANRIWNAPGREEKRNAAIFFALKLWRVKNIKKVCLENPLGILGRRIGMNYQIVHPYFWGDPYKKRTCLWLRGLKPLIYDKKSAIKPPILYRSAGEKTKGKAINWVDGIKGLSKSDRQRARNTFFKGMADAMAMQWGGQV